MKNKILSILAAALCSLPLMAQSPFAITIEPLTIPNLGGLQAYAWGQHNGKWLILGGRLDGLHRRQPFAAFDVAGNNNQLIVVDPAAGQRWTAPLTSLSTNLQEQLSATNMQFHQEGSYLYIVGGYGYNTATASRKTFDFLTVVDVPAVINAVMGGTSFSVYFRQLSDPQFAVTGGHLETIGNTFYLLGGNKFDGNYNPMGGPSYTQVYTDAVRRFTISDDGTTITVTHLAPYTDAVNLHRRDYNAVAQIMPNGSEGVTMFSGVFQPTVDLPFLNAVNVDSTGHSVAGGFQQYYNHYHCAVLPVYSASAHEMHTVFFGGIAQYYDSLGTLVQDDNVPFVTTIARVTRDGSGMMAEYKLPVEMPALLGAGAELIPVDTLPRFANGVFDLDAFTADTTLVGYIYGGISSTDRNIFFTNTGTQSSASSQVFKVYLVRNPTTGVDDLNEQSTGTLDIQAYPNPTAGDFRVDFSLVTSCRVAITLYDMKGRVVDEAVLEDLAPGRHSYQQKLGRMTGGAYLLSVVTPYEKVVRKIVYTP